MRLSRIVPALAVAGTLAVATLSLGPPATAVGPGGWDHLGSQVLFGNPASALNGDVLDMDTSLPGQLLAAGKFTNAGGVAGANRVASWNGSAWSAVGPPSSFNGDVHALAVAGGKIFAGGVFTDAGGDANADFLAAYDGVSWKPFCTNTGPGASFGGSVDALQVIGDTLYVGGSFANGASIDAADYLLACNITTGAASPTVDSVVHAFNGSIYALAADGAGNLYAGGTFINLEGIPAADHVAGYLGGGVWTALGSGPGVGGSAADSIVRSLADDGTSLYIGTDSENVGGIALADHVAKWSGSSWHALGADSAGTNGYFPTGIAIDALFTSGSHVYATGNWLDIGSDPTADYLADFDGSSWKPVSSDGAGNGALTAKGESFAVFGGVLHVGGNFTKAGGDSLASFVTRYTGVAPPPNNVATVGKAKVNKSNGTAKLAVTVPGAGVVTVSGKGIKASTHAATGAGTVPLTVKAKGKTLKKLKQHGKVKVTVTVTFTPTGGTARSVTTKVKLVRKR